MSYGIYSDIFPLEQVFYLRNCKKLACEWKMTNHAGLVYKL